MRVVVAGAGIGGLSTGLALARKGFEVELVERMPELREAGAGLQLSPNATKALGALGVAEAVEAISSEPQALELRIGRTGSTVFSIPAGDAARKRYGAPYLHIHRADLAGVLSRAAIEAGVRMRFGAEAVAVTQEDGRPRVGLDTGAILEADVVVGADGLHSATRRQLFGRGQPRFTGSVAWRALAPIEAWPSLPDAAVVWVGARQHAVTYRIRRGALINFVGVIEEEDGWREEGWDQPGEKTKLAEAFEGWAPAVTSVIGAARSVRRWALFDRDPLPRWSKGRVTLLGDACHPMPPFQAQGAAMAIEDAVVLARCLDAQRDEPEAALRAYETKRRPRTSRVLASARSNMGVFHRSNLLSRAATYGPMRVANLVAPGFVRSRQDWIYAFDAARS